MRFARRSTILLAAWAMLAEVAFTAVLGDNGEPRATIVLPAEPDADLTLAAQELQTYIAKSTGFELPVAEQLRYGEQNVIAVRVFDGAGLGGIYRPVALYAPADNIWIHGAQAIASDVPVEGEDAAQWSLSPGRHGATLRTEHREPETNPCNGAWIEYAFTVTTPGKYRVWLRLLNFQEEETKHLHLDGQLIGEVHGLADRAREYLFRAIEKPVALSEGEHILRIVCTGIVGDLDPINYVYMTRDLELDPDTLEQEPDGPLMNRPEH